MKRQKLTNIVIQSVLNFVKPYANVQLLKDLNNLLQPCCKPTLSVEENYACDGSNTEFTSVTVTAEQFKNKDVILLFTFSDAGIAEHNTATVSVALDENGSWTGGVSTLTWFGDGVSNVTVSVIEVGSKVLVTSDAVTASNIQNCD